MTRYEILMARIARGEPVLIDGATGTEIERRGVPQLDGAWNGGGALSHPGILRQVHADYIAVGADIIISNTFATHRSALRAAGVDAEFEAYNRRGVELARDARTMSGRDEVVVAAGMSHWCWTGEQPSVEQLRVDAADQARIFAEAGADVVFLEMMIEIDRMLALLDGVRASALPVWVGLTCGNEDGTGGTVDGIGRLRRGESLADAVGALRGIDIDIDGINIMHTDVDLIAGCLDELAKHWHGPVGVYAHSGDFVDGEWILDSEISPADYLAYVDNWRSKGINIVGGCCGLGPGHIAALRPSAQ